MNERSAAAVANPAPAVGSPFCRACGGGHPEHAVSCPSCGWPTVAMPPALHGPIGDVHLLRQRLRRRHAVRIGDAGTEARLLLDTGEEQQVPSTDLPAPAASPVPWASVVRSAPGRLLELAAAIESDRAKVRWDPAALRAAAVAAATDQLAARLLALDALALDMEDVLAQLPLTPSERIWLVAVRCAQRGDAARLVHQVAALPPGGYRPKLRLLLDQAVAIHEQDLDVAALEPQLRPFLEEDPAAAVLHRAFGLSSSSPAVAVADAQWLAAALAVAGPVRTAVDWGRAQVLDDGALEDAAGAVSPQLAGPHVRAIAGLRHPGTSLLAPDEVRRLTDPVVDDLIDAGSLAVETALGAPRDRGTGVYLAARLAPERLSEDELVALGHDDERARRTFPLADPAELERFADSPWMRHFRSLALVRLKRGSEVDLDTVHPAARAKVEGLLGAVAAADAGEPVVNRLTNSLLLDPSVWPILAGLVGSGALQPSSDLAEQFPAFCEWLALHHAREHLYRGDWAAAIAAADRCLGLATGERVRDEALNLKACGLHYRGDSTAAVAALEEAIEGAYSEALLANVGIVAARLQPEVAARHLGKLMVEAPTTAMRMAAGRRVVELWLGSDADAWHTSDGSGLPDVLRGPLRKLVADDIGIDDFRSIAMLLGRHDGEWFGEASRLSGSAHRGTLEARVYQARARGLDEMVDVVAGALRKGPLPDWLDSEVRQLREQTVKFVLDTLDDASLSVGTLPIAMYEKGLVDDDYDKVLFPAMGLASLALHYSGSVSAELPDKYVMLTWAMRDRWKALGAEPRERVEPIVELATRRVAINRCIGRSVELDKAIDVYNAAVRTLEATGNLYLVRSRIQAAQVVANRVAEELSGWLGVVDPPDVRNDLRETLSSAHELDARCARFL